MLVLLSACASRTPRPRGSLGGGGASSPARARRGRTDACSRRITTRPRDASSGITRTWTRTRRCGTPRYRLLLLRRERRRRRRRPRRRGGLPACAGDADGGEAGERDERDIRAYLERARPEAAATTNGVSGERRRSSSPRTRSPKTPTTQKNTTPTTVRGRRLTPNETVSRPRAIVPIVRRSEPRRPRDAPRASVAGGVHGEDGGGVERDWRGRRRGARRGVCRRRRRRRRVFVVGGGGPSARDEDEDTAKMKAAKAKVAVKKGDEGDDDAKAAAESSADSEDSERIESAPTRTRSDAERPSREDDSTARDSIRSPNPSRGDDESEDDDDVASSETAGLSRSVGVDARARELPADSDASFWRNARNVATGGFAATATLAFLGSIAHVALRSIENARPHSSIELGSSSFKRASLSGVPIRVGGGDASAKARKPAAGRKEKKKKKSPSFEAAPLRGRRKRRRRGWTSPPAAGPRCSGTRGRDAGGRRTRGRPPGRKTIFIPDDRAIRR